jgi:hypothetical protein
MSQLFSGKDNNYQKKSQLGKYFVIVSKIHTTDIKIGQYNSKNHQKRRKKM